MCRGEEGGVDASGTAISITGIASGGGRGEVGVAVPLLHDVVAHGAQVVAAVANGRRCRRRAGYSPVVAPNAPVLIVAGRRHVHLPLLADGHHVGEAHLGGADIFVVVVAVVGHAHAHISSSVVVRNDRVLGDGHDAAVVAGAGGGGDNVVGIGTYGGGAFGGHHHPVEHHRQADAGDGSGRVRYGDVGVDVPARVHVHVGSVVVLGTASAGRGGGSIVRIVVLPAEPPLHGVLDQRLPGGDGGGVVEVGLHEAGQVELRVAGIGIIGPVVVVGRGGERPAGDAAAGHAGIGIGRSRIGAGSIERLHDGLAGQAGIHVVVVVLVRRIFSVGGIGPLGRADAQPPGDAREELGSLEHACARRGCLVVHEAGQVELRVAGIGIIGPVVVVGRGGERPAGDAAAGHAGIGIGRSRIGAGSIERLHDGLAGQAGIHVVVVVLVRRIFSVGGIGPLGRADAQPPGDAREELGSLEHARARRGCLVVGRWRRLRLVLVSTGVHLLQRNRGGGEAHRGEERRPRLRLLLVGIVVVIVVSIVGGDGAGSLTFIERLLRLLALSGGGRWQVDGGRFHTIVCRSIYNVC